MSSADPQIVQALPAAPFVAPSAALPPSFATLAAELRLQSSDRARDFGPVAAIQALILALLARLLGRLDGMFQRWQQGQLPPPAAPHVRIRTSQARHSRAPSPSAWTLFGWDEPSPARPASVRQPAPAAHAPEPRLPFIPMRAKPQPAPRARPAPLPRVRAPALSPSPPFRHRPSFQKPAQPAANSHALFVAF